MQVSARTCSIFLVGWELLDFNILCLLCVFFYFFSCPEECKIIPMHQKFILKKKGLKHYCVEIRLGKHLGK